MALWKEPKSPESAVASVRPDPAPAAEPVKAPAPAPRREAAESLIAADLTIEGKIEGSGHVRIAGRFKGDVSIQGDLTVEAEAQLTGSVRARKVVISGQLEGNIVEATQVELQPTGALIGDLKAGSLAVAAGARMRGQVEFGWGETSAKPGRGNGPGHGALS